MEFLNSFIQRVFKSYKATWKVFPDPFENGIFACENWKQSLISKSDLSRLQTETDKILIT